MKIEAPRLQNRGPGAPKLRPGGSKIELEGLLEPIVDQCFIKGRFQTPKKRPGSAQELPKEPQDRPKPCPNGAQDAAKSTFGAIFGCFFSCSKFASTFNGCFHVFRLFFKSSTCKKLWFFQRKMLYFRKLAFSRKIAKKLENASQKPPKNHPKSMKNRQK